MKKKPRILFIFPGPVYDPETDFGVRARFLSNHYTGAIMTAGEKHFESQVADFIVKAVGPSWRLSGLLKPFKAISQVIRFSTFSFGFAAREGEIDLIVSYDPLQTGLTALLLSRLLKAKLVCEVNGDHTSDWAYVHIKKKYARIFKKWLFIKLEQFVLSRADGIKYLYSSQLDSFQSSINQAKLCQFPDYTNIEPFRDLGETTEILLVGFPFYVKGVDILIAAFKKIAPDFPEWRLTILGHYPDKTVLNSHIADHPQISHHPPVHHRHIPQYIGKCGIFCLASRTEAMGRVLIEAMACGKPRIGSKVGGIETVINDKVDGFLFESENIDQLADILKHLMSNPAARAKIGKAGAKRARKEFDGKLYFQTMRKFYDEVIGVTR